MVDGVDRPEAPRSWVVKETAASKDREQQQEQQQSQPEDEFSSPGSPSEWHKFNRSGATREVMRVSRNRIKHFWFHKAHLQRQTALVEGNLELSNGKLYKHVQVILPRFDDYFQLKGYQMGQELPLLTIIHEPMIDVSVPLVDPERAAQVAPSTTAAHQENATRKWWHKIDWNNPRVKYSALALYTLLFIALISAVLSIA